MKRTAVFVYLLCAVAAIHGQACKGKKGHEKIEVSTKIAEPEFKKEGTLSFLSHTDTLKTIDIEIADTYEERNRGMMHRSSMEHDKGMLFVFDGEEEQSFWMKNTKMSLDIMYVNANREIVSIYKHTQPYSTTSIPSMRPAQFVVETSAGFCDKFGIKEGDRIVFSRITEPV